MTRSTWKLRIVLGVSLLAFSLLIPSASADEIDPWNDISNTANDLLGRNCGISAGAPRLEEASPRGAALTTIDLVVADATMNCGQRYDEVAVTVCIQVRQAIVSESLTWQDLRCQPGPPKTNSTSAEGSVSAPCLTGKWAYRTKIIGEAHKLGSESAAAVLVTHSVTYQCSPVGG